jgi:hypothetical protein
VAAAAFEASSLDSTAILAFYPHGGQIVETVSEKTVQAISHIEAIMNDSGLMKKLAGSRGRNPDAAERHCFAKIKLALCEAGYTLHVDASRQLPRLLRRPRR